MILFEFKLVKKIYECIINYLHIFSKSKKKKKKQSCLLNKYLFKQVQ